MLAGLLIAYGLHLLGHIAEMVARWAYIPGRPTACITLPVVIWLAYITVDQSGPSTMAVMLWTVGLGVFLILNLRCMYLIAPHVERFLNR